ncbi:succinyl-diaminopimelate desuccinylase [Halarcobacter mediterraneus]|uniref:Succinyl-diaminopimelate desuccinylase n=1 Tax=Halarcobacter mediterraneus TaxID=2023153 RepID=A0A4Q1B2D2_9BACT|nr:succinyl-diaminopimelate desuccinylase [Halarcobacter mediterraneus]RXK14531.1 succinyl-diaminopimelate desuccinylase [Halarcobacter mediterraneus]
MTVIELFQKLLRFKSITPNDDGAFDFIEEYLGDTWSCIKVDMEGVKNRFYYKKFDDTPQHLCFAGHIDVVPVGNGWEVDPFAAEICDGVITARGTQDMKSGDAAFLYACKHSQNFKGTLSILMTSDEEGEGTYGTIKMLEHLKEIDFIPGFAVVAEPTCEEVFGDAIKVGRRGSINGYITIKGKQGHAAYPEKCINPVHNFAHILPKIAGHNLDNGDEYFAPSKMVITDIRGGMEVTNVTPNELKLMFNVRNSTNTTRESVEEFIHKNLEGLEYDFKTTQGSFPFVTNKESKVVKAMENSIEKVLNIKTKHSTAGGTSDARYFGAFGIEAIEFGVINDTIHSVGERTTVKEVEDLTKVYMDLIKNF